MEAELIRRLKAGDLKAFDRIYYMYVGRLMSYCLRYVKVVEDAEEIVEDVFISLWKRHRDLLDTDSLQSLLFVSVRRRIINRFRAKIKSPIYEDYVYAQEGYLKHDGSPAIEYEEFEKLVFTVMETLPSTQLKVVMMAKFYNMSNDKIAECLSLSKQTVKNALSAGLKTLRERLKLMDDGLVIGLCLYITHLFCNNN